jgi:hypothetical protein
MPFPPWLFRHKNLIQSTPSGEGIDKKMLTNILNLSHFKGNTLQALLSHPRYPEDILIKVHPEPCLGDQLSCRWDETYREYQLEGYRFQYLS